MIRDDDFVTMSSRRVTQLRRRELMMTRSTFGRLSCLSVAIGLVAACGPIHKNLGDDATGGKTNEATGGNGGANSSTGGFAATGGAATTGGFASTGDLGVGGQGAGGQGVGGQGVGGGSVVPYVVDPTLPIDPTCTCPSSDEICNAASQCVPRCDDSGRCAKWLANHAVRDLLVEGSFLYYAVAAVADPLGNPGTNGSLYRVETNGGTPTLIAEGLVDPYKILGRYNGVTYIETQDNVGVAIVSVSDTGAVANLDQDVAWGEQAAMMWGHWIAYVNFNRSKLMGVDLTGNLTPVVLGQVSTGGDPLPQILGTVVLDNQVLYTTTNPYQTCSVQLSNLVQGATCADGGGSFGQSNQSLAVATAGDPYFSGGGPGGGIVWSYAPPNTRLLNLFDPSVSVTGGDYWATSFVYANSWLYMDLQGGSSSKLVRVPTTVGRLPQAILPDSMATRDRSGGPIVFAVSTTAFFWVQSMDPTNASSSNQPQYIFSAPLPPYPCDADLPCADSTQVCSNGFCG